MPCNYNVSQNLWESPPQSLSMIYCEIRSVIDAHIVLNITFVYKKNEHSSQWYSNLYNTGCATIQIQTGYISYLCDKLIFYPNEILYENDFCMEGCGQWVW